MSCVFLTHPSHFTCAYQRILHVTPVQIILVHSLHVFSSYVLLVVLVTFHIINSVLIRSLDSVISMKFSIFPGAELSITIIPELFFSIKTADFKYCFMTFLLHG